jgi:hypothetical protein
MSLADLQDGLQRRVLNADRAIEEHVVGSSPQDVAVRLAIYSDAYATRLREALASNYPALAKLLGASDFAALAAEYMAARVSRRPSIRYYGDEFAGFLVTAARYREVPLLAELAGWEWAMTEVFDAADAVALGADTLALVPAADWSDLCFDLHPALRLLELCWNVPPLWKALTSDQPRPAHELAARPQAWLQWRDGLQVVFRSVAADEACALRTLMSGGSFGELCGSLGDLVGEAQAPVRAAACLRGWLDAGLITGISPHEAHANA